MRAMNVVMLTVVLGAVASAGPLFNHNFELGSTTGWTRTGTAFDTQPTYGDNPNARGWPPIGLEGSYFLGLYENRPTPADPAGRTTGQGDAPLGTLTSAPFVLHSSTMDLLIGGGNHPANQPNPTAVVLKTADGTVVRASTGTNNEVLSRVTWNTRGLLGQTAVIQVLDWNTGDWGHVNVDDFQLGVAIPAGAERTQPPNWDFESGDLSGWTVVQGTAFNNQPTYGDNPVARGFNFGVYGSNPLWPNQTGVQGGYFIGTYENRPTPGDPPGGVQGDGPVGVLESEVFTLESPYILVRVGGGNHPWPAGAVWNPSNPPWAPGAGPTCINLERLDGTVLFTATGRNTEAMWDVFWDTSPYLGELLRLRIYDQHSGGWGHINVDFIQFIPEPSGLALLALGLVALAWCARRKSMAR